MEDLFSGCQHNPTRVSSTEMFGDPDAGLELRDDIKIKIQKSLAAVNAGDEIISAEKVAAKLGLTSLCIS